MKTRRVSVVLLPLLALIAATCAHGQIQSETIYENDFEETPREVFPRIDFLSDRNVLFSSLGQSRVIEVQVYDAGGQLVPNPAITWQSQMPGVVSVSAGASGIATVQSVATWTSPISLTASYSPLGLEAEAKAIFATLAPQTVLIESAWVQSILGDRAVVHTIALQRNSVTETLNPNDILASGDYAGIMVRALSVQLLADRVVLGVEPVLLTQAFQNIEFTGEGEPMLLRLTIEGERGELTISSKRSGAEIHRKSLSKQDVIGLLRCSGGLSGSSGFNIEVLSFEQSLVPRGGLRIENYAVVDFLLAVEGSAGIEAGVSVALNGSFNLEGSCEAALPSIALGWFPFLGPIATSVNAVPIAGISASIGGSGSLSAASAFERRWSFSTGVRYTDVAGWSTIAESSVVGNEDDSPFDTTGAFGARIDMTAGVAAEAEFSVGVPGLNFDLVGTRLATFKGGPLLEFSLPLPISPELATYQGPSSAIGINAIGTLGFSKNLFEGNLATYLPLTLSADLMATFFNESIVLSSFPSVTGQITCTPNCQSLAPGSGRISASLTALATENGTASFYIGRSGEPTLSPLGTVSFGSGIAELEATVPAGLNDGTYFVYGRLRLNGALADLTGIFPLAPDDSLGQVTLGPATPGVRTAPLNDTGFDQCGNNTFNLFSCPLASFPDQDGDHGRDARSLAGTLAKIGGGAAGFDYTKISNSGKPLPASAPLGSGTNDWACTRDNVTGLIWEVKTNNPTNMRHRNHRYSWYSTDVSVNGGVPGSTGTSATCSDTLAECNTQAFVAAVNAQGLCGANDWRMPTPQELLGIVHYGRSFVTSIPLIDPIYFGSGPGSNAVWTRSTAAAIASFAWHVDFTPASNSSSHVVNSISNKSNAVYHVQLVRAGQ